MNSKLLQSKIAKTLRSIGSEACLAEAKRVEALPTLKRRFHFRSLGLTIENLEDLLDTLDEESDYQIKSISFSHNPIGDEGASILAERLPDFIEEIGLVDCGISDVGGRALIDMLGELPDLDMICMEENQLSDTLKLEYQKFAAFNPDIMVMV